MKVSVRAAANTSSFYINMECEDNIVVLSLLDPFKTILGLYKKMECF